MRRKLVLGAALGIGLLALLAAPVAAQDADAAYNKFVLDNLWVFIAGVLVFLMQAGFALVEAGLTRAKNVSNIMAKNLADMIIGSLAFFVIGWTIAYGEGGNDIIGGFGDFFFKDSADPGSIFGDPASGALTPATSFFFQVVFAATAVTIASGAMAERTKFQGYLAFSAIMTAFIYPIVVHWTWGGGLIANIEIGDAVYTDFAGSGIVHMTGGIAALMGALFLGPRIGKYGPDGKPRAIPGHSIPLAITGVFILWFGWFGFNPGSELLADEFVPFIALNTLLAASAGGLGATIAVWSSTKTPDVGMIGNGVLAGLVSITAGAGTVEPWGAIVIGLIGGFLVVGSVLFVDRLRIDDPVGAFSVHGVCGAYGVIVVGLFARYDDAFLGRENAGLLYGGGFEQLAVQIVMVLIIAAFVAVATAITFAVIKATIGLRVPEEMELAGLDVSEHGGSGYGVDTVSASSPTSA